MRRRELREGTYTKHVSEPVLSTDYVKLNHKVINLEIEAFGPFIAQAEATLALQSDDDSDDVPKLTELAATMCRSIAWPNFVRLVPEITRVSGHRGEAYELLQHELQPLGTAIHDQPVVRRTP